MFKKIAASIIVCLLALPCESFAGIKSAASKAAGKVKSDAQDLAHLAGVGKGSKSTQEKQEKEKEEIREAAQNKAHADSFGAQQQNMKKIAQQVQEVAKKRKAGK